MWCQVITAHAANSLHSRISHRLGKASLGKFRQVGGDRKSWSAGSCSWARRSEQGGGSWAGQVKVSLGGDGKSWNAGYWQLGWASQGKSMQVGGDGKSWNAGLILNKIIPAHGPPTSFFANHCCGNLLLAAGLPTSNPGNPGYLGTWA